MNERTLYAMILLLASALTIGQDGCCSDSIDQDGDGYVCTLDCDDSNPDVNPDAAEACDGLDNDCNPDTDEHEDRDGDGLSACDGDCDDDNDEIYPGQLDECDGLDNDCDETTDEDEDGDGYTCDQDCDEADSSIYQGAEEVCNGVDTDCDGRVDLSGTGADYFYQTVNLDLIVVDDFEATCPAVDSAGREWYYSRIGTDRGEMGDGSHTAEIGGGHAVVVVNSGWAGVWTSLKHRAVDTDEVDDTLDAERLLGPYIVEAYQSQLVGVELLVLDGSGRLRVELKKPNGDYVLNQTVELLGGPQLVQLDLDPIVAGRLKEFNWLIDGAGWVEMDETRLMIAGPELTIPEAGFLFTLSHLSQTYLAADAMTADRAMWPAEHWSSVQTVGMHALLVAIAAERGYVETEDALEVVRTSAETLRSLPTCHGVLPHFVQKVENSWEIVESTEWSSVDTVLSLTSGILALQLVGESTAPLETLMSGMDWETLSQGGTADISMGFTYDPAAADHCGEPLEYAWDVFGGEQFIMSVAYAAANGASIGCPGICGTVEQPGTWDGSGFNDEVGAVFYPMDTADACGSHWGTYRCEAAEEQLAFLSSYSAYVEAGLFGGSASEVPEPCVVSESDVYGAWGTGGCTEANDGSALVGYPIVAPHYAALIMAEHPQESEQMFLYLLNEADQNGIFSPLNNVESVGLDEESTLHWNSLKGSWNSTLMGGGFARALYAGGDYPPYRALQNNDFLLRGFSIVMGDSVAGL